MLWRRLPVTTLEDDSSNNQRQFIWMTPIENSLRPLDFISNLQKFPLPFYPFIILPKIFELFINGKHPCHRALLLPDDKQTNLSEGCANSNSSSHETLTSCIPHSFNTKSILLYLDSSSLHTTWKKNHCFPGVSLWERVLKHNFSVSEQFFMNIHTLISSIFKE